MIGSWRLLEKPPAFADGFLRNFSKNYDKEELDDFVEMSEL